VASGETEIQEESKSATTPIGADFGALLTVPPVVGYRVGAGKPKYTLALSWSVQFGPMLRLGESRGLRPYRALLEPGLSFSSGSGEVTSFFRWGLRRMWQGGGILGAGLGCGITHSLSNFSNPSISPEALITLGRCCSPGMAIVSIRYEYSLFGDGEVWTSLGFALW
jgi:hypothetical protein